MISLARSDTCESESVAHPKRSETVADAKMRLGFIPILLNA
jgi:hypothetical protein